MIHIGLPEYHPPVPAPPPAMVNMELMGVYAELNVLPIDGSPQFGASSVHFDSGCELLWAGNQGGHITSYYGPTLQKYTSFQIHHSNPVLDILSFDDKVLSLTKESLKCSLKRGLPVFNIRHQSFQHNHCMMFRKECNLLVGGRNPGIVEIDLNTEKVITSFAAAEEQETALFRGGSKFVCCGGFNGQVLLRDTETLKIVHTINAHSGIISDFDVSGHLLITCGYSQRSGSGSNSQLSLDHYVKMYDLRMMRALSPIQCIIQPHFLRFMSSYTRRMAVMSKSGQFLCIEDNAAVTPNTPIYQANLPGTNINNVDVSETTQAIAFADTGGYLHLWSTSEQPSFNKFCKDPEFAPVIGRLDSIHINDDMVPLSIVPMPYCNEPLLSDWNPESCVPVSRRPPPISPELLRTMKVVHGIGYAPNSGKRRRNQVPYKLKDMSRQDKKGKQAAVPNSPLGRDEQPHLHMVPKKYRKVIFKYSKLGDEENEMIQHYNKTNFAGLEPNIPNAYCNCMLQVLYFIEPLRIFLQSHHNLNKEFDLAEELGFLFHMQDSATSGVLQASNFLRAFRTIHEASALGLLQRDSEAEVHATASTAAGGGGGSAAPAHHQHGNLGQLIQNWNRFILQQLHTESAPQQTAPPDTELCLPDPLSPASGDHDAGPHVQRGEEGPPAEEDGRSFVEKLFGTDMKVTTQFRNGRKSERHTVQLLFNLSYPSTPKTARSAELATTDSSQYVPFSQIIKNSICSQVNTKSWDPETETYQPMVQNKTPRNLPEILTLNCALKRDENFDFWKNQSEKFKKRMEEKQAAEEARGVRAGVGGGGARYRGGAPSSDAWNVFAEREGLDLSFERRSLRSWVPLNITMKIQDGDLVVTSENDLPGDSNFNTNGSKEGEVEYELHATIIHVDDPRTGGNLVAHIHVSRPYHQRKEGVTHTQWYLFNDFQISAIDKEESVDFDLQWKVPCILYYTRKDLIERHPAKINFPLTSDILLPTPSIAKGKRSALRSDINFSMSEQPASPTSPAMTFMPLLQEELPNHKGILVALDAEFVTLNAEEAELHSDGTRSTIRPCHLLPARVTVVRGEGALAETPFIDDYISTQEQVVDYLTKFSGIKPGDLDIALSSKHLSTLKLTYCKLRYLVQCGCIIVGHGLSKDFKVINIYVPQSQVRDTVQLFHMPRKRYISLRFLAWYFLGKKIQKDMHDSIEDAVTALRLYKKYLQLTDSEQKVQEFKQTILKKLYDDGRKLEWKVPDEENAALNLSNVSH